MKIDINSGFAQALQALEHSHDHLFITGKAGVGKSTLLNYFTEHSDKNIVTLAPTGVAALNVNGQTIHRFFNFYIDVTVEKIKNKEIAPFSKKIYKKLETIIIDEISMVRADMMDCIDAFLQLYGPRPNTPFGGVQMIFIGDLYQLPPVVPNAEKEIFRTYYDSPYFFSAHVFKQTQFKTIELEQIYRQSDPEFIHLLNQVRNNTITWPELKLLNQRCLQTKETPSETYCIQLTTVNQKADAINQSQLDQLPGIPDAFNAKITGEFSKEYYPTLETLQFKAGAQIMMINNDPEERWVNGSLGMIESISDQGKTKCMHVKLADSGQIVKITPHKWEVYRFTLENDKITAKAAGTFTQFPIRLAWAVTIHKSQGKTFDHVVIDLGRGAFVSGQLYVALSRCTRLDGIRLANPIQRRDIITDPAIQNISWVEAV